MSETVASPLKRSRNEAVELIEQVRRRPCLWQRACAAYRDRGAKEQAWQEVCRALEPGYDDMAPAGRHEIGLVMMRKWYNIRDAFKKYYSSKGNAAHSSRPYVYADRLAFLIPLFERKREPARCEREPVKCERVDDEQEEQEEWLSVFDLEPTDVSPPKRTKTELEYPRSKEAEPDDSIVSILVNLIAKEDDEDRAFFKSITPTVKSLPEQAKFLFRIQVMKLLSKLKQNSKSVKNDSNTDGSDTE